MSRAAISLATKTAETLTDITTLIEYARHVTARARRTRHVQLMRSARRIGEQLHAQHGLLSTIQNRELLFSARALATVCHGRLDAITEQLDNSESYLSAITGPRVHAVQVISQRRTLENLHTR